MIVRIPLLLLIAVFCLPQAHAEFTFPNLTKPVHDNAGIISSAAERTISDFIRAVQSQTGTQIAVLTVNSLEGMSIEGASIKVVDTWKLGKAKDDAGVLLLISKKDRKMRIEVGQGLEGSLTDAYSKRIITEVMVPLFREGNVDSGVMLGVRHIVNYAHPELKIAVPKTKNRWRRRSRSSPFSLVFILIFLGASLFGRRRGRYGLGTALFWRRWFWRWRQFRRRRRIRRRRWWI